MKSTVAPYQTRTFCLRIVCVNGLTIRITRHPFDLTMSNGQVYLSGAGYDVTAIAASSNFSPSAIDLEGVLGFAGVTRDLVASGTFDNARAYVFACDFLNPVEDYEPLMASTLGKATLLDDRYVIEEMGLVDVLSQARGKTYTALCQHTFGDARCGINLAAITVTGTLTHATSNIAFRDSGRAEAADTFTAGTVAFTSGLNAGLKAQEIKAHAADGSLEVFEPFHYPPAIGDAYTMTPGCRKRKVDCQARSNVINALAFWDIPTGSDYAQIWRPMTTDAIIAAARACIGTPFLHQGRTPGKALDCAGLARSAAEGAGYSVIDVGAYGRSPANGLLETMLDTQPCLVRVFRAPLAGDLMLMRFMGAPQHLAICAGTTMIHAWQTVGKVAEHNFTDEWKSRVVRVYAFTGVEA